MSRWWLALAILALLVSATAAGAANFWWTDAEKDGMSLISTQVTPAGAGSVTLTNTDTSPPYGVRHTFHLQDTTGNCPTGPGCADFLEAHMGYDWPPPVAMRNLSAYKGFSMKLTNNNEFRVMCLLWMNTGWTDSGEPDCYYDSDWVWLDAGETMILTLDFSDARDSCNGYARGPVDRLHHVTAMGYAAGTKFCDSWVGTPGCEADMTVTAGAAQYWLTDAQIAGMCAMNEAYWAAPAGTTWSKAAAPYGGQFTVNLPDIGSPCSATWADAQFGYNWQAACGQPPVYDLSAYSAYSMKITNDGDKPVLTSLALNTGWTSGGYTDPNNYYESAEVWLNPGATVTLTIDFGGARHWTGAAWDWQPVVNLHHVSGIGYKVGTNYNQWPNDGECGPFTLVTTATSRAPWGLAPDVSGSYYDWVGFGAWDGATDDYDAFADALKSTWPPAQPYVWLFWERSATPTWLGDGAIDLRVDKPAGAEKVWEDLRIHYYNEANPDPHAFVMTWPLLAEGFEPPLDYHFILYSGSGPTGGSELWEMTPDTNYDLALAHCTEVPLHIRVKGEPSCYITPTTAECCTTVTYDSHASADSGVASVTWDFGDGGTGSGTTASHHYTATGSYTVVVTVVDNEGLRASCTATVTVGDTTPPTCTCPADIVVDNDPGVCGAVVTWTCTATDTCTGDPAPTCACSPASGSFFDVGTTPVNCTCTDYSGNTSTCSFNVTVNDTEAPVARCQDITVDFGSGKTVTIVPADVDNGSSDNCPGLILVDVTPNYFCHAGAYTVTLTVEDDVGLTDTCTATVTVVDNRPTPTDVYVDDDYAGLDDCTQVDWPYAEPGPYVINYDAFATIHDAITAVAAGGTVHVAAGNYSEGSQIVIDKDVTVVGAGMGTTTVTPSSDTGSSSDSRGWWLVQPGKAFSLSQMTLDGTGKLVYQGIRSKGLTTIDHVHFTHIQYNPSTSYAGVGVVGFDDGVTAATLDVTDSVFDNIGRIAVMYFGNTTGTCSGSDFTGKGPGDWLDYAVEVGGGGKATITGNTMTACQGVASVDGSVSGGVLVTTYWGAGTEAKLLGNDINGNSYGVLVGYDVGDTSMVMLQGNDLTGNDDAGLSVEAGATVDAGDCSNSDVTGLGSSAGLNVFTGYGFDDASPWAVENLNTNTEPDVLAQDNYFGAAAGDDIEDLLYDDSDTAGANSEVVFSQVTLVVQCPPAVTVECPSDIPARATTLAEFLAQGGMVSASSATVSATDSLAGPPYPAGCYDMSRDYTITDDCGNVVTCTQIITVDDTIDPTCSVTAASTAPPCGEVTITITKSDNCDPDPAVIDVDWGDGTHDTNTVHQYLSTGTFTITVTVEDECSNTGTCSDTVTVPGTMVTLNFVAGWNMISIPCEPWTDDFVLLFGGAGLVNGKLYRYNHTAGSYDPVYDTLISTFPIERGRGYWLWANSDYSITFLACCSTPFDISCPTSGWYLIGYPHATAATAMSSLQVDAGGGWRTFTDAVTILPILCQDPLFWYNPAKMGYDNVGIRPWDNLFSMELGKGYWFLTFVDNVTLRVP